jgi:hypothetical protein
MVRRDRRVDRLDAQIAPICSHATHCLGRTNRGAARDRGLRQRVREIAGREMPVFRNEQAGRHVPRQQRFGRVRSAGIEPRTLDVRSRQIARRCLKAFRRFIRRRHLERPFTDVRDTLSAIHPHVGHELIVESKTPYGEVAKRPAFVRFVVGREHTGGCLRRALADAPWIEDEHVGPTSSQLVRHRAPNHACAHDNRIVHLRHGVILVACSCCATLRSYETADGVQGLQPVLAVTDELRRALPGSRPFEDIFPPRGQSAGVLGGS